MTLTALLDFVLLACPPEFRREYRAQIRADIHDDYQGELLAHGHLRAFTSLLRAAADLVATGLVERATMMSRDLIYALRSLRRTPLFAAVVIATLAIAIAANAAVFSVVNGVLLKPLPYPDPDSLVAVYQAKGTEERGSFSYPNFSDLRERNHTFADIAAAITDNATMTGHGRPAALDGRRVTAGYFSLFGVKPQSGRFFESGDMRPGSARAVVISDRLLRTTFSVVRNRDIGFILLKLQLDR